jgi:hypothetical protein
LVAIENEVNVLSPANSIPAIAIITVTPLTREGPKGERC